MPELRMPLSSCTWDARTENAAVSFLGCQNWLNAAVKIPGMPELRMPLSSCTWDARTENAAVLLYLGCQN
jgi:hypothetical protein